jgi:hypothetical protein
MLSISPAASPSMSPEAFETFLATAVRQPRTTRTYALDHGVDEPALLRYASGAVNMYERKEIEHVLIRCEWAQKFVVDHIKSTRQKRNRNRVAA